MNKTVSVFPFQIGSQASGNESMLFNTNNDESNKQFQRNLMKASQLAVNQVKEERNQL